MSMVYTTDSPAIVNTSPSLKKDRFNTVTSDIEMGGLKILREIRYLTAEYPFCTVSHETLAFRTGMSVSSVKRYISRLEDYDAMGRENRKAVWIQDKDGKRKRKYCANRYWLKPRGHFMLDCWFGLNREEEEPQEKPYVPIRRDDVWHRRRKIRKERPVVEYVRTLTEKINKNEELGECIVAQKRTTLNKNKNKEKGDFFSHGEEKQNEMENARMEGGSGSYCLAGEVCGVPQHESRENRGQIGVDACGRAFNLGGHGYSERDGKIGYDRQEEPVTHEEKEGRRERECGRNNRTGSGSGCRTSPEKKRGEISENVRETNSREEDKDVNHDKERGIEDPEHGAVGTEHSGCSGASEGSTDSIKRDVRGATTEVRSNARVEAKIEFIVSALVDRDSYTYALIPRRVKNLLRDKTVDRQALLDTLNQIYDWKIIGWGARFDKLLAEHSSVQARINRNNVRQKEECLKRHTMYDELDKQKQNRTTEKCGLMAQFIVERDKVRMGEMQQC